MSDTFVRAGIVILYYKFRTAYNNPTRNIKLNPCIIMSTKLMSQNRALIQNQIGFTLINILRLLYVNPQ